MTRADRNSLEWREARGIRYQLLNYIARRYGDCIVYFTVLRFSTVFP